MRTTRIAVAASVLSALALPFVPASSAHAAPQRAPASTSSYSSESGPWAVHRARALKIRSHPSSKSTARGVLYKSHNFTARKKSGGWVYVIDKTTGVKGWVSGKYVYRTQGMCLD